MNTLKIVVNGFDTEIHKGTSVIKLLEIMEEPIKPDMIVEINRRFIHLKDYENLFLKEGDKVEIIHLDIGG